MQGHNLWWLEVESQYRVADLNAATRTSRRPRRQPVVRFPAAIHGRRVLGQGLIRLGARLVEPRQVQQRSAA